MGWDDTTNKWTIYEFRERMTQLSRIEIFLIDQHKSFLHTLSDQHKSFLRTLSLFMASENNFLVGHSF